MTKLLLLMLMLSFTILGNNAFDEAQRLTNQKVLAAKYKNDGRQKLFVITKTGAYLFVKNGSFSKFFAKTFKSTEPPLFRSAGLTDIDNNWVLDFWYATKSGNKKLLYVVNTTPKAGKYSLYSIRLQNGKTQKSANLKSGNRFHRWMENKVRNLNENITIINPPKKRPPLQVVAPNNAYKTAQGLVSGRILKAGFYQNNNNSKFLYVITQTDAYLFLKNSNSSYSKYFSKKLKNNYQVILNQVGMYDVKGNGFGDFYYTMKNNNGNKILFVVNTRPKVGKYSFYMLMKRANGSINKSANLKNNGKFHNWMKKKLGLNDSTEVKPIKDTPMLPSSEYKYICDITTNGKGGYRTGGKYCAIAIKDFEGYEVIFQPVYGKVDYIAAHERLVTELGN